MRYEEGGTLNTFIHGNKNSIKPNLSLLQKLSLLENISRGLAELHEAGIIHGDINPDNILLDSVVNPKIRFSNFGLSSITNNLSLGQSTLQLTSNAKSTPVYSAPEMLINPYVTNLAETVAKVSRKTDIYAFSILAWEILSQNKPFVDLKSISELSFTIHRGNRPPLDLLPIETPTNISSMITDCWSKERKSRMTAVECYSLLSHHYQILTQKKFNIFFSHAWKSKPFLSNIFNELVKLNYRVWYDQNEMGYNLQTSMIDGIAKSDVILVCANQNYQNSPNCMFELNEAKRQNKKIVTLIIEENPFSWAKDELKLLTNMSSRMFVDVGQISTFSWDTEDGISKEMINSLRDGLKPLINILNELQCLPNL
jgi:serine/threonine protein kinase